jgi:hypothetical protein
MTSLGSGKIAWPNFSSVQISALIRNVAEVPLVTSYVQSVFWRYKGDTSSRFICALHFKKLDLWLTLTTTVREWSNSIYIWEAWCKRWRATDILVEAKTLNGVSHCSRPAARLRGFYRAVVQIVRIVKYQCTLPTNTLASYISHFCYFYLDHLTGNIASAWKRLVLMLTLYKFWILNNF